MKKIKLKKRKAIGSIAIFGVLLVLALLFNNVENIKDMASGANSAADYMGPNTRLETAEQIGDAVGNVAQHDLIIPVWLLVSIIFLGGMLIWK